MQKNFFKPRKFPMSALPLAKLQIHPPNTTMVNQMIKFTSSLRLTTIDKLTYKMPLLDIHWEHLR